MSAAQYAGLTWGLLLLLLLLLLSPGMAPLIPLTARPLETSALGNLSRLKAAAQSQPARLLKAAGHAQGSLRGCSPMCFA